jgi:uncharacterized membrane protein
MTAIINAAIFKYQERNINDQEDLNRFNRTWKAMTYTPYVDFAIAIIAVLAANAAVSMSIPVSLGLVAIAGLFAFSAADVQDSKDFYDRIGQGVQKYLKS